MQFDITGLLIFLVFILPGFLAQRARRSLVPQSLKPLSTVAEVGEYVLAGVCVHVFMFGTFRAWCWIFDRQYFEAFINSLSFGSLPNFLRGYFAFVFDYLAVSLVVGYCFGFVQGWLILRQPIRSWMVRQHSINRVLSTFGIPGFLQEDPVWYFVLKQQSANTMVFVEVEMKGGGGFYTGRLRSYGILDDSVKSKDFYLEGVHFRESRSAPFVPVDCDGLLLNFEDVASIQVRKGEPEAFLAQEALEASANSEAKPDDPKRGQSSRVI
ncbi:MAG TPA: DUF6338 family protein [Terriglobales bacterium]|nr:DUF6338 family protein [Terriglobales bacterium]